jgi:hypothetical protein
MEERCEEVEKNLRTRKVNEGYRTVLKFFTQHKKFAVILGTVMEIYSWRMRTKSIIERSILKDCMMEKN